MRVLALKHLREFWEKNPRAKDDLRAWYAIADKADWSSPQDIKNTFRKGVDFVGDNRVIFDIRHNEFRLIVRVSYQYRSMLIKFVGTHAEYDRIDPETV
ncbi:type II toxin-antitoxin system HigB family toxin [Methylobacterium sp. CB376]|uniref:type II toxin-antitoxin system HigB family toxin n=1 Tax=unclassified Methylobacterium TaxID=2615210 RepID=UPI001AEC0B96|nr:MULTISPECIES: type II toxin-antitoxin system HigB family toxin [Methylobacterium]WFT83504.1 type II toxin-antitoxin system HigB family toxin [Methylobacterium nodulans]